MTKAMKVNVQEAKTHLSRYLERVEKGEVVVVCRHNRPIAKILAIEAEPVRAQRVPGLLKGQIHWTPDAFAPLTEAELAEFEDGPIFPVTRP